MQARDVFAAASPCVIQSEMESGLFPLVSIPRLLVSISHGRAGIFKARWLPASGSPRKVYRSSA